MRRTARSLAVAVATVLLVGSCGVSTDPEPRAINGPDLDEGTGSGNSGGGDASAALFFQNVDALVPIIGEMSDLRTETVLTALLNGVPEEDVDRGFVSQIPSGTRLLRSRADGTLIRVDLSEEFDNVTGAAKAEAVGQIVLTASNLAGVESVSFAVEGDAQSVFSPAQASDVSTVSACDFISFLPNDEQALELDLTIAERTALTTRRAEIGASCDE